MKTKILFVCLGNICRSPAAEAVFWHQVTNKGLNDCFEVDSAGTGSWHVGQPSDQRMRIAAQKRGINISSLARQINLDDFQKYDLILTMDKDNLDAVLNLGCHLNKKIVSKIKPLLSYAENTNSLEVPDPYYGGDRGFDLVLDLLDDACNGLISQLTTQV